ncbi:F-box protein SKIP2-like protein [Tanacetum coccineum]
MVLVVWPNCTFGPSNIESAKNVRILKVLFHFWSFCPNVISVSVLGPPTCIPYEGFFIHSLEARDSLVITTLEYVREYLMKRIVIVQKVNESRQNQVVVNLANRSCSCRKWEVSGIPCKHPVSCIFSMTDNGMQVGLPEDWVHQSMRLQTWKTVYSFRMNPVLGREFWEKSQMPSRLIPPYIPSQIGRPGRKRKKSAGEVTEIVKNGKLTRKGGTVTCCKCGQKGHNKRSCKGPSVACGNPLFSFISMDGRPIRLEIRLHIDAKHSVNLPELILIGVSSSAISLEAIASNCQKLERLALCGSETITDSEISCIASKCVALKKLCIKGCPVSDEGIKAFAWGCPNLIKIKVKKCRNVTGEVGDWLKAKRGSLVVNLDVCAVEVESVDASASDGAQEDVTDLPTITSDVAIAQPKPLATSSSGRGSVFRTRCGLFGGRGLVSSTFKKWLIGNTSSSGNSSTLSLSKQHLN